MVNPLDQIMSVQEAAKLWGLSPHRVKGMCQNNEVKAKKIGNSWVLDRNQPNPKKYKRSEEMFTIVVKGEPGSPYTNYEYQTENEQEAIEWAKKWAEEHKDEYVFIRYFRSSDGQQGYLNPCGYDVTSQDWSEKYKQD